MSIEDVYRTAREYLAATASRYEPGQDEYYARVALEQALVAGAAGNFGIGAVAVVRTGPTVAEYRAGNALFTAAGVSDHAEVRALTKWRTGQPPDDRYAAKSSEDLRSLVEGVHVFGTVEPCPMCVCALTHVGAARSVSTVLDGELVIEHGHEVSDGAACAIGAKHELQPRRWRQIQAEQGLTFTLLLTDDRELQQVSEQVWKATEHVRVRDLAQHGTVGKSQAF